MGEKLHIYYTRRIMLGKDLRAQRFLESRVNVCELRIKTVILFARLGAK
jgi:hypothetical protein